MMLTDGADVLYNKFNVDGSSPPNNPPRHPNSDYNCVVATTDHWKVSRCDDRHLVICQSDYNTLPGMLSKVYRPTKHIIGHIGDGFYGSNDPTDSVKALNGREVLRTRLQSH